jgi:hypothetical protein
MMLSMKIQIAFLSLLIALSPSAQGTPAAEKLLPEDTLAFLTVPDFAAFREVLAKTPQAQMFQDPATKAFREHFLKRFKEEVAEPIQRDWGIDPAGFHGLAQGQVTLAFTENGAAGKTNLSLGIILLLDAKDQSTRLKENLAEFRKNWTESGKSFRIETIRDVEFFVVPASGKAVTRMLEQFFPNPAAALPGSTGSDQNQPAEKTDLFIGQSGSLLIAANSAPLAERVLDRQSGGTAPSLSSARDYELSHQKLFRESHLSAWVNGKRVIEIMANNMAAAAKAAGDNPFFPRPDALLSATGLQGVRSIAFSYRQQQDGAKMGLFVGVPESARKGIFDLWAIERKEAGVPGFIPADAVKFTRSRIGLQKSWKGLENMLKEIMPPFSGAMELIFEAAGKDQDPNFDLRRELVGNLGEDLISYEKLPQNLTVESLDSPPSIYLLGSPDPNRLGAAVRVLLSLLMPQPGGIKERDFLGRKIYSLQMTSILSPETGAAPKRALHLSPSGGYLAISTDPAMIEEYLRSSGGVPKALKETSGLDEAAHAAGGTGLGLFGFNNRREEIRAQLEIARNHPGSSVNWVGSIPLASAFGLSFENSPASDWADASLLPPFEAIAKYFHYSVYAGSFDADGLTMKFFSPTPPRLRE